MSANAWYAISLVGYFAALLCLITTIVLYVRLDILDVIGDLSGRTVAKELKSMRESRNAKGDKSASRVRQVSKSSAKSGKSAHSSKKHTRGKTVPQKGQTMPPEDFKRKKAKNGTAEMGSGYAVDTADKLVLHSKTDKLSRDTEELYEDFDPRVEYSRTDILEEEAAPAKSGSTAVLKPGTAILEPEAQAKKPGTAVLEPEAEAKRRGTAILEEPAEAPAKRGGTDVLPARGTAVLRKGTELLDETSSGGTTLLVEEAPVEPVKFSITRSYLVVHSEEKIL